MTSQANLRLLSSYRNISRVASGVALAVGFLVLVGWRFNIPVLTSMLPGLATMKANTALGLILCGISLWSLNHKEMKKSMRILANACVTIVLLIAALTLGEYLSNRDFGIDQLFFQDTTADPGTSFPGRMSPAAALNLLLLGCALLLIDNRWSNWLTESLTITALLIAGVAVIGYIYAISSLYQIGVYASMALHTALAFIVLCVGILSARPEHGLISILSTEGTAGILARRLLPAAIGLPIVLGWLILTGQRIGHYDTAFGIALFALLNVIIFSGLIRWNADMLHRAEVERNQARNDLLDNEKRYRRFFENMHETFVIQEIVMDNDGKPIDLRFLDLNPAAERILGKTRGELVGRTRSEVAGRPDPEGVEMASRVASTGVPFHMIRSSPGFGRSFESFTYSLGSGIVATLSLDITERKKAEEALNLTEQRLRALIENSWDAIALFGADGTILYGSPSTSQILGYSLDEFVGRNAFELIHEEDRALVTERVTMSLQQPGAHIPVYARVRHKNGEWRWLEGVFTNLLDEPSVQAIVNNYHDFTERKQDEDALRESEAHKSAILESALDCIITIDHQGQILEFNPAAEATFGYTRNEAIGKEMAELIIPPSLREQHRRGLANYLATGEGPVLGKRIEINGMRADGTEFPVELAIAAIKGEDPPVFTGFLRDITQRKQSEQALRENEERLHLVVQAASSAMIVVDSNGKIDMVNERAQTLFGYEREELLRRPVEMLVPDRFRSVHPSHRKNFLEQPASRPMGAGRDLYGLHKDGHEIPIEIGLTPYESSDGLFTLALIVDITERKRAEEALKVSEKRFRLIVEAAPSAMIVVDRDGKIDLVNAKALELFGYRKEELLGRPVEMLVPERFRSWHPNYRQSFLAQPTSRPMGAGRDLFGLHKDGYEVPIEIGLTPYESSDGFFTLALIVDITERKRAEEKIAYQAYLLENVNDAVIGSDENSLIRFWNQGAERILGWKAEEVLGRSGREILRSEFIDTDRETVLKILAEHGRWRGESILYRKDGSRVIMEVSSITLRDANGMITGYVSVNRDIAERKQAEKALKVSEERFRLIVEAAPSAIIAVDAAGKINLVNAKAQELFGYRKEELLGRPVEMLIPDRFRSRHIGYRQNFLMQPTSRSMGAGRDLFCLHKDGHEVPVEIGLTPYESSEGLFTLALIVDITERKQAEAALLRVNDKLEIQVQERTAALSEANALLQMLLDHMPDHIYFKDTQSRFIRNSRSQARALGLNDPAEAVGKSDFDFFPHAQQSFELEQEIIRSGRPLVSQEERVLWPDGTETWVSTTKMPLLDPAGQIIGTFGISRDITQRKQAEMALQKAKLELEAANEELEAFSYSVSHDLRAPLRSVDGFSQALLEDYAELLPPEGRNFLERIRSSAQRMAQLIDDLLNLSRVTRAPLKFVPVDLTKLAENTAAELKRTDEDRHVNFIIAQNLRADGDPHLLQIVLENLMNNAWKFTSKRELAEIEVGIKNENGDTVYFIRDNGAGFDMAYANKLFGAFQRLHAMTEFPGTGIGLATIQRIIHRHGGRVWAEGTVDEGATFFFTLPVLSGTQVSTPAKEEDSIYKRAKEII